jgi:cation:H+ antiporter
MFNGLGLPVLLAIFAACAGVIWVAGVKLADTTDILSSRLHLGKALGGIIVLAIATNLPEVAITVSAALAGNLGVAVGNILGGIAIQTVVLVAMDIAMEEQVPLTYRAASLTLVVEAVLVIVVLIVSIMATQLPGTLIAARLTPGVDRRLVGHRCVALQQSQQGAALARYERHRSRRSGRTQGALKGKEG